MTIFHLHQLTIGVKTTYAPYFKLFFKYYLFPQLNQQAGENLFRRPPSNHCNCILEIFNFILFLWPITSVELATEEKSTHMTCLRISTTKFQYILFYFYFYLWHITSVELTTEWKNIKGTCLLFFILFLLMAYYLSWASN